MAESLRSRPQETLYESISDLVALKYSSVEGNLDLAEASRRILAECLKGLNTAAGQLSDQLTSQHFSHIDYDLSAVSA